eukprot:359194-Chlamydomonas_euryale.AAC.14
MAAQQSPQRRRRRRRRRAAPTRSRSPAPAPAAPAPRAQVRGQTAAGHPEPVSTCAATEARPAAAAGRRAQRHHPSRPPQAVARAQSAGRGRRQAATAALTAAAQLSGHRARSRPGLHPAGCPSRGRPGGVAPAASLTVACPADPTVPQLAPGQAGRPRGDQTGLRRRLLVLARWPAGTAHRA